MQRKNLVLPVLFGIGLILFGYAIYAACVGEVYVCGRGVQGGCAVVSIDATAGLKRLGFYLGIFLPAAGGICLMLPEAYLFFRDRKKVAAPPKSPESVESALKEAEMYLAYGRNKSAALVLKAASQRWPNNSELIKKLENIDGK